MRKEFVDPVDYDQLNRITAMDVYRGLNNAGNHWNSLISTTDY
ncbi:MAG: hypothetical protein ABWZ25_00110 [Chitinophagaceae bacterium]